MFYCWVPRATAAGELGAAGSEEDAHGYPPTPRAAPVPLPTGPHPSPSSRSAVTLPLWKKRAGARQPSIRAARRLLRLCPPTGGVRRELRYWHRRLRRRLVSNASGLFVAVGFSHESECPLSESRVLRALPAPAARAIATHARTSPRSFGHSAVAELKIGSEVSSQSTPDPIDRDRDQRAAERAEERRGGRPGGCEVGEKPASIVSSRYIYTVKSFRPAVQFSRCNAARCLTHANNTEFEVLALRCVGPFGGS